MKLPVSLVESIFQAGMRAFMLFFMHRTLSINCPTSIAIPLISSNQLMSHFTGSEINSRPTTLINPPIQESRGGEYFLKELPEIEAHYEIPIKIPKSDQPDSVLDIDGFFTMMRQEENRITSFAVGQWPHEKPNPSSLAKSGFFYCLLNDTVQCAYCRACVGGWNRETTPDAIHKLFFPHCPFIRERLKHPRKENLSLPLSQSYEPIAGTSTNYSSIETLNLLYEIQQRINCKICFEREVSVRFNCKHIVTCKQCSVKVNRCPVCRCTILKRLDVIIC